MATTEEGIYYQDDYTKNADILADMKKMAESVDEVVQEEKENQETIEQKIQELQTEQTAQNKKIEQLDDNQIHITTEKASNINVKDASGQNGKIGIFGISEQKTRSGKNKFNIADLINVTDQNIQTGSFVASSLYGTTIINNINLVNLLKPNTNYKCIANVTLLEKPATITSNIANMLTLYKSIAPANNIPVLKCSNTTEKNNWQVNETKQLETTFTTDNDLSLYNMLCYCYANDTEAGGKFKFENIMILEATEQDETFEQYGAMPSPEFKSEIENIEGDVDVTVCNKNIFDENAEGNFLYGGGANLTTKNEDGTFTTTSNFSVSRNKGSQIKGLKENTDYIISINIAKINSDGLKGVEIEVISYDTTPRVTVLQQYFSGEGIIVANFNSSNYKDLVLHISGCTGSSNTISVTFKDIMIAEKSNDNSYVAHEQQITTFPLAENQKMFKGSYTADNGIHHKRKQIELDGTEAWQVINENVFYLTFNDIKISSSALMTHFKYTSKILTNLLDNEFTTRAGTGNSIWIKKEGMTLEEFKTYLAQQKQAGTPVIVEYELAEEEIEPYTEEQQEAYNQLQNAKTYKTVTNVFTNNAEVEMNYIADTKTYVDNEINSIKNQLNTINELLSTTTTSAMLLDNMQSDLESEVL